MVQTFPAMINRDQAEFMVDLKKKKQKLIRYQTLFPNCYFEINVLEFFFFNFYQFLLIPTFKCGCNRFEIISFHTNEEHDLGLRSHQW